MDTNARTTAIPCGTNRGDMKTKYKSSLLCRPEEDAVEEGLTPSRFDVAGDAVILRLERNEDAE
jgi:hypothetical protein